MREQIDRIKRLGISNHELQTARFRLSANISHSFERILGPGSKAELLSLNWTFSKDANPYMRSLACITSISATHLQKLAGMLGEPALVLEIEGNQTKPRDPAGLYINTTARHAPASVISHSGTSAVFTSRYPIIAASHARSSFFDSELLLSRVSLAILSNLRDLRQ
jgi:hypothetical protein